jgi:hypothetical protein
LNTVKSSAFVIVSSVVLALGCRNLGTSGGAASTPPPAASPAQTNSALARLPPPVAAAFQRAHPAVTPMLIHVRLFPDGTTHYQITYLGSNGEPQQADYVASGQVVPPSQ